MEHRSWIHFCIPPTPPKKIPFINVNQHHLWIHNSYNILAKNWRSRPLGYNCQNLNCNGILLQALCAPESWLKQFFWLFSTFFVDFRHFRWILITKCLKSTRKVEIGQKEYFHQLCGACSTQNLAKIHNLHNSFANQEWTFYQVRNQT